MSRLPRRVVLRPADARRLDDFREEQVAEYADQKVRAGEWAPDEAPGLARATIERLLGEGAHGHEVLEALDAEGTFTGWIWLGPPPEPAPGIRFLYQITVVPGRRGSGWGGALLRAAEAHATRQGAKELRLNVFLFNRPALALYAREGYSELERGAASARFGKRLQRAGFTPTARSA